MADPVTGPPRQKHDPDGTPAASTIVSLSQVLLAPLNSILKAQVHAARSFLDFVLQLAGHDDKGPLATTQLALEIPHEGDMKRTILRVPIISLVPLEPLTVKEASFKLEMQISHIAPHRQRPPKKTEGQPGTDEPPKWYLVEDPISVRGTLAPPSKDGASSSVSITVTLGPGPVPAGLQKLLTSVTQTGHTLPAPEADGGGSQSGEPKPGTK